MSQVLLIGETAFVHTTEIVAGDAATTGCYSDTSGALVDALATRHEVEHLPSHLVGSQFPSSQAQLDRWQVVILSDIGASAFQQPISADRIDRLGLLAGWVREGGSVLMIGGFLSFAGFHGKARYHDSPLAGVLPVEISAVDDRHEEPAGARPAAEPTATGALRELLAQAPAMLGWNRTRAIPQGRVLASIGQDPLLAVREIEHGRTAAFTSDCAPHWAPAEFLSWSGYTTLWCELVSWLAGSESSLIS